ncbi:MAG TPA: GNAT family N-acetyltransferase [Chloroflexia bacterium]|nr:GNAT family N-acetyltransferase [Chloroflexia bacterium]
MSLVIEPVVGEEAERLLPVLQEAEEGEERIRAVLRDPTSSAYVARLEDKVIGAAVVRWEEGATSELIYIALDQNWRGRGYGKKLIRYLQEELGRRKGEALLVGTANAGLDNIAFYQKCGFRMYEVRRDFFNYIQPPISENGIVLRDMIVFRYEPE